MWGEPSRSARTDRLEGRPARQRVSGRSARPKRSRLPGTLALSAALVSLAFALFYISPLFRVSQVTVVGAETVGEDKVVQAADVEGQNILAVDRAEVAKSVAEIPMVKSARVSRNLPGEVVIAITERHPWAIWQVQDAKYLIDDEGVVISTATPSQGLVTIVDMENRPVKPGSRVEPKTVEMAYLLTQLLPNEVGVVPKRFEYRQGPGLIVISDKGWQAKFGDPEDVEYKVATLKGILSAAAERKTKVEVVDLRYQGRPYYR